MTLNSKATGSLKEPVAIQQLRLDVDQLCLFTPNSRIDFTLNKLYASKELPTLTSDFGGHILITATIGLINRR